MNGRPLNPGNSSSQKNLIFNNIRYVKPMYFMNQGHHQQRNLYYDNNPYSLNHNPLNNRIKGIYTTGSRNSNTSRDNSQTSSQRSGKVVRANGLRLAQKPKISKGLIQQRQPSLSQSRAVQQTRKLFDRNIELQEQNRALRDQNSRLRENMKRMEQSHKAQIIILNSKFELLVKKTEELQNHLQEQDSEWKKRMEQFSNIKVSNTPQMTPQLYNNANNQILTPTQYYNGHIGLNNTSGNSNIKK